MNFAELVFWGAFIGLGATVVTDVAGVMRQGWSATHGFYCLVGRWVGSARHGVLAQGDVRNLEPVRTEAALGWSAHIALGVVFGIGFVAIFGPDAVTTPNLARSLIFGLVTVFIPWLIFQPLFGWGVAMAKAPEPWKMRVKGIITHTIFGFGLWVSAMVVRFIA
ncbi:DUF2938 family protein [Sulfitobacter geojensis]|uniref:DUF2938 family protein n=1 Tax=Sulfitobacter geojensis TaxID=1342299 RepID=UPI003B8D104E